MTDFEAVTRDLEALRQEVTTRTRRLRILGVAGIVAGLVLLAVGVWIITSPSGPTHTPDYVDVISAETARRVAT